MFKLIKLIDIAIRQDASKSVKNKVDAWIKYGLRNPNEIIAYQINFLLFEKVFAIKIIVIRNIIYWKKLMKILVWTKWGMPSYDINSLKLAISPFVSIWKNDKI